MVNLMQFQSSEKHWIARQMEQTHLELLFEHEWDSFPENRIKTQEGWNLLHGHLSEIIWLGSLC